MSLHMLDSQWADREWLRDWLAGNLEEKPSKTPDTCLNREDAQPAKQDPNDAQPEKSTKDPIEKVNAWMGAMLEI